MVAGMTSSGKTIWVKSLLQQAQRTINLPPERIVVLLFVVAVRLPGIDGNNTKQTFVRGIPSNLEHDWPILTSTNAT